MSMTRTSVQTRARAGVYRVNFPFLLLLATAALPACLDWERRNAATSDETDAAVDATPAPDTTLPEGLPDGTETTTDAGADAAVVADVAVDTAADVPLADAGDEPSADGAGPPDITWQPDAFEPGDLLAWGDSQPERDTQRPETGEPCPIAVAACSVRGDSGLPGTEVLAVPLDVLECSSAGSSDYDGTIVRYRWSVVSAPEGSAGVFDSPDHAYTTFFVDISGAYTLQLDLVDDDGNRACEPATVRVQATYDEDFSVQLTWDTPGDPNEEDTGPAAGSDVDIHLVRSGGCWGRAPWDCHWRSKTPDWGVQGNNLDDPSIDRDDVDSLGPENVNLNNPEAVRYHVGVNYYDSNGFGPVIATVRIFIRGDLVLERTRELTTENAFWHVADVTWPGVAVTLLDLMYPTLEGAPCP